MSEKQPPFSIGLSSTARANKIVIHDPVTSHSDIQCTGVVSRSIERAYKYAKNHNNLKIYPHFEDMIVCSEIDIVYIASPNTEHESLSLQALQAGKHVLCEKPLIISPDNLEKLIQTAGNNNVLFMEAMHYPYHPVMNELIQHVKSSNLDDIKRITFYFDFPYPDENDIRHQEKLWGGTFAHLGCYVTDILTHFFDDQIRLSDLFCIRNPIGGADNFCMGTFQHQAQPNMQIEFRINFLTKSYKAYVIIDTKEHDIFIENPFGWYVGKPIVKPQHSILHNWPNSIFQKTTYDFQIHKLVDLLKEKKTSEVNILGNALFWECWQALETL